MFSSLLMKNLGVGFAFLGVITDLFGLLFGGQAGVDDFLDAVLNVGDFFGNGAHRVMGKDHKVGPPSPAATLAVADTGLSREISPK